MALYDYNAQNDELKRIAGGTLYDESPVGVIIPYGGTAIPTGWLLCDGRAVSRTIYAGLFAVIGTAYGAGDGSTTFNIPDLREAVPKGAGLTGLSNTHLDADGLEVGEFIDDRIKEHQHQIVPAYSQNNPLMCSGQSNVTSGSGFYGIVGATISSEPALAKNVGFDTNEVKAVGCNYIIKALQISAPANFVSAIDNVIEAKGTYSITEIDTGKVWIDGKKIYRKCFNNPSKTFSHNISNFDGLVDVQGIMKSSNRWRTFPSTYIYESGGQTYNNYGFYEVTSTQVQFISPYDPSTFDEYYVIIEYTKSE